MKTRQIVALIAAGCVALISLIPIMTTGYDIYHPQMSYVWWLGAFGIAVAAVIIVAAFWKD